MAGINWTKSGGWTVDNEKTDHRTDFKTDHPTNLTYTVPHTACYWKCKWWKGCWNECKSWTTTHDDHARNEANRQKNEVNTEKNNENTALNSKNTKRNDGYAKTVGAANSTKGGDYTTQRQLIRNVNLDASDGDLKNRLESLYKDYYRSDHLEEWDTALGKKPLYGDFDASYYITDTTPGRDAKTRWDEAKRIDDIDITERYGNSANTYYLQHYTNVAPSATRGNKAEVTKQANEYIETAPTDAELGMVRTLQLGTDLDTQTQRILNIPEVAAEWEKAKRDDPHWRALGKEKFLDVNKPDEFAALFRLSERPEDQQVKLNYNVNAGYGITQLEDAINQAAGEKALSDTKKFGALTQSVLNDTIEEMKRAKGKEQTIATMQGFSGFSEIMDINKTLTDSLLGDTGIGGMLAFTSGGKAEESLEKNIMNVTGIGNNVTHNWQKWFDEKLVEKYGKDRMEFLPLDRQSRIMDAWESEATNNENPYDTNTGKFTDQFLNQSGFDSTKELEDFLKTQSNGENMLTILKEKWTADEGERMRVTYKPYGQSMNMYRNQVDNQINDLEAQGLGQDLSLTIEGSSQPIQIEADFARNFINEYLEPRFDTSRSMDEFVEYLDVRQQEQNPFQTQDALTAVKLVADLRANKYLEDIKGADDRRFNADFYFNPSGNTARGKDWTAGSSQASYAEQKATVEQDWANAKAGRKSGDIDWAAQAYRFGIDFNNKEQFARMHFQIVGQGKGYDAADDILNASKVKDQIYNNILPALNDEALKNPTVFGQFITPEEFADDMLEGLDPTDKSGWDEVLQRYGLKDFKGSFDELKEHVMSALRTGSAQDIREQIKYLNEKRQKPEQRVLGVTYIEREEDYKDEGSKPETELYSIFQKSGFQGTEDEFYDNFFPDLERSDMRLLTKAGKDTKLESFGLDMQDPFASLGTIESFFDEPEPTEEEKEADKNKGKSYFTFELDDDDDDEWEYRPRKKENEVLDEFTTMFRGL